jgi:cell division transport system ATP-binding protein
LVELQNAGLALGRTEIVRGACFAVGAGSLALVYGGAGSGKTSLLALIRGILAPSSGDVVVLGEHLPVRGEAARAGLRRRIGLIEARPRFLDHLDLRDNLAVPLLAAGLDPATRAEDLDALLRWTALAPVAGERPAALAPAERRRAALARALICGPDLLLADEPSRGLDAHEAMMLLDLLVDLNRMGQTIILATGEEDVVEYLGARAPVALFHLRDGRIADAA